MKNISYIKIQLQWCWLAGWLYMLITRTNNRSKHFFMFHTNITALIHPSNSGLLVTCAYLPQTTLPDGVTNPRSATFTSMIVPFVITPSVEYIADWGFFLTPMISRWNVVCNSGWVTCAFLNRRAAGRMNRSYLGGLRVKLSPTNVTLLINRFHCCSLP